MKLKQKQTIANIRFMDINTEPYTVTQVLRILTTLIGVPSGGMPSVMNSSNTVLVQYNSTWPYGGFILPQSNYRLGVDINYSDWGCII